MTACNIKKKLYKFVSASIIAFLFAGCASTVPSDESPTMENLVEDTSSEEATSEETIPEETTLEETIPEETTPEETTPEETTTESIPLPEISECPVYTDYPNYEEFDRARDAYYSKLIVDARAEGRKIVYLTFDDGSTGLTRRVLDTLDEYHVKATFFVVGEFTTDKSYYNEILARGNSLGSHTIAHARAEIYTSLENFQKAVDDMNEFVYKQTGTVPYLFRFPGGASTSFSNTEDMQTLFIPYLKEKNMIYYDWNVSSGDGGGGITSEQVYENVIEGVKSHKYSVVLMHDGAGHEATIEALPQILDTLINEMNCLVVPITKSTVPIQTR